MTPQPSPSNGAAHEATILALNHTDHPASSSDAASSSLESSDAESISSEASSSSEEDSGGSSSSGSESAAEVQPTVSLRSRLAAFIPQMAAANEQLLAVDAVSGGGVKRKRGGFEIVESGSESEAEDGVRKQARGAAEDGDEAEDEEGQYIEMNLGLGVLEETNAIEKDGILLPRGPNQDGEEDSESDTAAGATAVGNDRDVMGILTAIRKDGAKRKNKSNVRVKRIEEIPK